MRIVPNRRKFLLRVLLSLYVVTSLWWGPAAEAAFKLDMATDREGVGVKFPEPILGLKTAPGTPLGAPLADFLPKPPPTPRSEPQAAPAAAPARPVEQASAPAVQTTGNCARVAAAWPGDDAWVLRNARRESGCSPSAWPGVGYSGPYCGVLQMNREAWNSAGGTDFDSCRSRSIEYQVGLAWNLYQARGCQPWGCR